MNESLAFFQPWMALLGAFILCGVVIHKRAVFRHAEGASTIRQFLVPTVLHFIPATISWFFVVMVGVNVLTETNHPISGLMSQAVFFVGFIVLSELILGTELRGLKREQPKW